MTTAPLIDQACPFCGLACDDLVLQGGPDLAVRAGGGACPRATRLYAQVGATLQDADARAWIAGAPVPVETAVQEAARLLGRAQAPLFGGLSTDVHGMRSLVALADRCGAVLDHMNADGKLRNLRTVQDAGWITTTLSEVRNRADVVVCFGSDVRTRFPRFFERCVWVDEPMFAPQAEEREVIFIGAPPGVELPRSPAGRMPQVIDIPAGRLPEAAAMLRGLIGGSLPAGTATDLPLEALRAVAARLHAARYGVVVWVAADMDWPHAELCVQSLTAAIGVLNQTTRAAGLPLGGSDGDFSADAVMLWQTGYPYRSSLATGTARYEPVMNATAALLARDEIDFMLWTGSFDPERRPPDPGRAALVALTCVGTPLLPDAAVQIQIATPGVDAAGYFFRADKVVALPLRPMIDRQLPSVAQLASRWLTGLGVAAC